MLFGMIRDKLQALAATSAVGFVPDRPWWESLFSAIDSGSAASFASFLTTDAEFRFGNAPPVTGQEAISAGVAGFFAAIASSRHRLLEIWSAENSAGCEGEVTYSRHDGTIVTYPFANVFKLHGEKISSYHIYIDNSSLFASHVIAQRPSNAPARAAASSSPSSTCDESISHRAIGPG
jgi:hypothetical protein